ncbi:MAG: alpha/beta hydrolase [Ilumatobacter sp.]|nr:alpha/beta hydrolase [Ilumatobacter sp.]
MSESPSTGSSTTVQDVHDDTAPAERVDYDEFGLFHENIAEFGLDVEVPVVERVESAVPSGDDSPPRLVSALRWGTAPPEVVFVHGGAQNAHTWDTVALALGRPAFAVDLPGHGHSGWRADGAYTPADLADDVAVAVGEHARTPVHVVGMSLGGLTAMMLARRHPRLVDTLTMVDITPGVNRDKTKAILDFVDGPQAFPSFDDLLQRTVEFNPTRSESSLRRGILHNARQLPDGSWQWRYDRTNRSDRSSAMPERDVLAEDGGPNPLWDDFAALTCPLMIVRGSLSPVVDDADVAEATRRQPALEYHLVDGAGHSVQGDRPVELAALIDDRLRRH